MPDRREQNRQTATRAPDSSEQSGWGNAWDSATGFVARGAGFGRDRVNTLRKHTTQPIAQQLHGVPQAYRDAGGGSRGTGAATRQALGAPFAAWGAQAEGLKETGPTLVETAEGFMGADPGSYHRAMGTTPPSRGANTGGATGRSPRGDSGGDPFGVGRSVQRMQGVPRAIGDQNYIEGADGRRLTLNDLGDTPGLNTMSPEGIMRPDTRALSEAQRAAAARGDWSALERIGAVDQRGGSQQRGGGMTVAGHRPGMEPGADGLTRNQRMQINQIMEPTGRRSAPTVSQRGQANEMRQRFLEQANRPQDQALAQQEAAAGRQQEMQLAQLEQQSAMQQAMLESELQSEDPLRRAQAMNYLSQVGAREAEAQGGGPMEFDSDLFEAFLANQGGPGGALANMAGAQQAQQAVSQYAQSLGAEPSELLARYQEDPDVFAGTPILPALRLLEAAGNTPRVEGFAEGGLIPDEAPMSAMASMQDTMGPSTGAMGAPGSPMMQAMGAPAPMDPMQVEYEQYAQGAQSLGLPAIPFEEFMELRQTQIPDPAQQPPMGMGPMGGDDMGMGVESYALGGEIPEEPPMSAMGMMGGPDVSGAVVMDPDPNAPTDSIPALIDGDRPAALDSGEFVMPDDVVRFHGTKRLQQLIDQARQSEGGSDGAIAGATQG